MVYYLVCLDCRAHVESRIILGIASNKNEIFELIFNYYEFMKFTSKNLGEEDKWTLENDYFDILIYSISKKHYKYFKELYSSKSDEIEDKFNKIGFTPTNNNTFFWYGIYINDARGKNELFSEEEFEKYKNILRDSDLCLMD